MSIIIDHTAHTFTLHTAHTTYQMKVDELGVLLHTSVSYTHLTLPTICSV